jgi:hypothetical protein
MTPTDFALNIIMIFSVYLARENITRLLEEKLNLSIKTELISYLLVFWLVGVVIGGMLYNTEKPFGTLSVSESMQNLEPAANKKPHRWFDINFDVFDF